jgi:hypothetical protein
VTSPSAKRASEGDRLAIQTFNLTRIFDGLVAVDGTDLLFLIGWAVIIFAIGVIPFRRSMRS